MIFPELSLNTKAILLLTQPLLIGEEQKDSPKPLTPSEYNQVAGWLVGEGCEPADLLDKHTLPKTEKIDSERVERLLERGFLLSLAIEHWHSHSIWVISRADDSYPKRLSRLGRNRPHILYGCGDIGNLDIGGLAVVGARDIHESVVEETKNVGALAAQAGIGIVSGGARGSDMSAMQGAVEAGGQVVGVIGNAFAKKCISSWEYIGDGRVTLMSEYDPSIRYAAWRNMQRNKLIYALADAALVVRSSQTGTVNGKKRSSGTWEGAVEHLKKHNFVLIYVWDEGEGLLGGEKALLEQFPEGTRKWTSPRTPYELQILLAREKEVKAEPTLSPPSVGGDQGRLPISSQSEQTSLF